MSKAQTDIRTTSYDALSARPFGYQGTIDEVIAQIRAEDNWDSRYFSDRPTGRSELRVFLGVPPKHLSVSNGPSVELDANPRYGDPDVPKQPWDAFSPYSLEYAMARWPQNFTL
jgi:hypothetical protein